MRTSATKYYNNKFVAEAQTMIADNMRKFAKELLTRLNRYTPVDYSDNIHAYLGWEFCIGMPPANSLSTNDYGAYARSMYAIESWDGIKDAHIYNNTKKYSESYPDGYMYLIKVNAQTAKNGTLFIERAIEEAERRVDRGTYG